MNGRVPGPAEQDLDAGVERLRPSDPVPYRWSPQYGLHMGWPVLGLLLVVTVLTALGFATETNMLLLWAASLGAAVFCVSLVLPGRMIHPIDITKIVPDDGMVGEPVCIKYFVRNRRRYFGAYSVRLIELIEPEGSVELPRVYIPYLGPGQRCEFQVLFAPIRRGRLELKGTRIASRFPLGLLVGFKTIPDGRQVTIYPALGKLMQSVLPGERRMDIHGAPHPRFRGLSDEFYALREYRRGDNPRLIHWKRSARMGKLLVREMTQYAPQRLTLVLDTYAPTTDRAAQAQFEQAVSFVATLVCHSLESGLRVALVCASIPPEIIPPLAGREVQRRMLTRLSQVELQDSKPLLELTRNWRWTGRWHGRCLVISVTDPGSGLVDRLGEQIGPVRAIKVGSPEWEALFMPPAHLRIGASDAP